MLAQHEIHLSYYSRDDQDKISASKQQSSTSNDWDWLDILMSALMNHDPIILVLE